VKTNLDGLDFFLVLVCFLNSRDRPGVLTDVVFERITPFVEFLDDA
jgi:hypothetical protein